MNSTFLTLWKTANANKLSPPQLCIQANVACIL